VSAYPPAVTEQMVANFARGGAAINQICLAYDLGLKVLDLALEVPTGDITTGPAMDETDCARTIAFGMEAVAGGQTSSPSARWGSALRRLLRRLRRPVRRRRRRVGRTRHRVDDAGLVRQVRGESMRACAPQAPRRPARGPPAGGRSRDRGDGGAIIARATSACR
jgi:hypothetical protein